MKFFGHLLFFCFAFSATVMADQHTQKVKPVRATEILNYTQFLLKEAMSDFLKKSISPVQLSPTQIFMQTPPMRCGRSQLAADSSELFVARTSSAQQIRESLILKTCSSNLEIFSLEREGQSLVPTPDDDLLRGKIPGIVGTSLYRLYLRDRNVKLEILQGPQEQKMEIVILLSDNLSVFKLNLEESLPAQDLNHQHMVFLYMKGNNIAESHDTEYIWSLDQNSVPREYFYYQQKEIVSGDFTKIKDSIYTKSLYPLLLATVQFASSPL